VDDNPIKKGVVIHGLKVLGRISDIPKVALENNIRQLIIALPSADNKTIKSAVELGRKAKIRKIKIAPPLSEIIKGQVSFRNLKDIGAEDLLGREQVTVNTKQIENFIKNKAVLITGAAGSIGSELARQVAKFKPSHLLLLDQDETGIFNILEELKSDFSSQNTEALVADVTDKEKINEIFKKFRPKIIFHAAAYKHVPLMEANPAEAVKNNIFGTKNLAEAAVDSGSESFIFVSTDKAVNPTSVMGATKRAGEMICQVFSQKNQTKFISVRFGNVLDSRGSVIPVFREQIKKGGPVTVTDPEMKRYFMLIPEACLLVMQSSAMGQGGEVFILDMGKPIMILDLAREMIKLSGFIPDKDIAIVFCGKRPGEKLFEEMLTAEEGTDATQNNKIFKAKLSAINLQDLEKNLENLKNILKNNSGPEKIISALKSFIPYYKN
jgi:FlaA1/EpsC-like NDP-sugar epimerase